MSRTMCTSRIWPPEMSTSPTPSTVSIPRRICLSAISVSARRLSGPESAKLRIGSSSGSTFAITGGRSSGGRSFIACDVFSRTSWAASLMSRSSTNLIVIFAIPSRSCAVISSIPEMLLSASSVGSTTALFNSSALAPGSVKVTETVAGSAFGRRSTLRSRKEKIPVTTNSITSIVVNTGRRTQNSASDM